MGSLLYSAAPWLGWGDWGSVPTFTGQASLPAYAGRVQLLSPGQQLWEWDSWKESTPSCHLPASAATPPSPALLNLSRSWAEETLIFKSQAKCSQSLSALNGKQPRSPPGQEPGAGGCNYGEQHQEPGSR